MVYPTYGIHAASEIAKLVAFNSVTSCSLDVIDGILPGLKISISSLLFD